MGRQPGGRAYAATGTVDDCRGIQRTKERGARLETNSALLASDFALKRVIATYFDPTTYSPDTLASAARSYQSRIGVDLLWIADDQGRLLVNLPASPKGARSCISATRPSRNR